MNKNRLLILIGFIIIILAFFVYNSSQANEMRFESFYTQTEDNLKLCIFKTQNNENNCEKTKKVINENNNIKHAIVNNSIANCTFSKFGGHLDKPIFDTTIYRKISIIDTTIVLKNQTIRYKVEFLKTLLTLNYADNSSSVEFSVVIPNSINLEKVHNIREKNRLHVMKFIEEVAK